MPKNSDGKILIHYDSNFKELTQVKRKVQNEISNIDANPNISNDFKKEIDEIWKAINSNSGKLERAMNKMVDIELSTKNFEKYQSNIDSIIDDIKTNISTLDDKLESIGQTDIGHNLSKGFEDFTGHLKDSNSAIIEIIKTSKQMKSSVSLTNERDISSLNTLLLQLKEARALRKKINDDPASYLDFTGFDDSDLIPYLKSLDSEYKDVLSSAKDLQKQMAQMDTNSDTYKIASAQLQYFRLELKRVVEQYGELYSEASYRDDINIPKNLKQSLDIDDTKKFFNSVKSESKIAQDNLEGLVSTLMQTAEVVKKEDLGGNDGAVKVAVKISTSSDTLYRQLIQTLDTIQDKVNKRGAIVAPVKIVVEGTPYSESKKDDLTNMARDMARNSLDDVTADVGKITNNTIDIVGKRIRAGITSAFENAWIEIIDLVKNTILPVYAEVTPETIESIENSLKSDRLTGAINFNKGLDEAEQKLENLSEKAKLLVDEINKANNNDFVSSLSKISESLNELKGLGDIITKINENKLTLNGSDKIELDVSTLKKEFTSLNDSILELKKLLEEPTSLDSQWFKIGSLFNELADDNGKIDFRKRKQDIKEFLDLYEKYVSLGGTNTLSLLTGNVDTLKKLQDRTSYSVSHNSNIEESNSQFKQVGSTLDMIQEKINLVRTSIKELRITEEQIESFSRLASACDNVLKALTGIGVSTENNAIDNLNSDNFQKIAKPLEKINALTNITTVFKGIKISKNNVDNLKELVPVLKELSDGLKNLDTLEMNGFLSQIQDISKSADNLEHLATIISSSQKELKKSSEKSINTPSLDKEITKPIDKILKKMPKLNQEVSKYEFSYGKILVQIEEELDKFQSIRNKKILNEEDITTAVEIKNNVVELEASLKSAKRLASEASYAKNLLKMQKGLADNSKWAKETKNAVKELIKEQEALGKNATVDDIRRIGAAYTEIETKAIAAGKAGASFFDAIRNKLKYKWAETFAMFFSFYDIVRYVKEISSAVTELNSNLIELSKVSDTSIGDLYNQFNDFYEIATKTGNSISGVISATADWSRMGYSLPDSKKLAEVAQIYKNVGDGISIDEANEYLISTLQGFQKNAEEALHIVDIYNEVANHFAIDTQGIGEALERSAASFYAANTSLEESVALVTTANTVLQNPEQVGTVFKTLSARLRGAKTELEELGEEATVTTSNLQATVKALTGFDILKEDGETYKSIYEILVGIGKEWENLTDIERASLGEMLAGKRNSNALYAVLQNVQTLESAYETAQNSANSAIEEQERYMQGIAYSVEQFKVAIEDISNDILDSEFAKKAVDFGTSVIRVLDKIVEHPLLAFLIGGSIGGVSLSKKIFKNGNGEYTGLFAAIHDVTQAYKEYIVAVATASEIENANTLTKRENTKVTNENALANQSEALTEMQQAQAEMANTAATEQGIVAGEAEFATDIARAEANVAEATTELTSSFKNGFSSLLALPKKILKGFINLVKAIPGIGIAATLLSAFAIYFKIVKDIEKGEKQLRDSAKELGAQYSETKKDIESYKKEITELQAIINDSSSSYEETANARERLLSIQDSLIEKYGNEHDAINNITSAIEGQIEALDKLSDREWRRTKREFEENNLPGWDKLTQWTHGTNSDLGVMLDEMESANIDLVFNGLTNLKDRQLVNEIEAIYGGKFLTSSMNSRGLIELDGSLQEIYDKLLLIQQKAEEIGVSKTLSKSINKQIEKVTETLDSYEEFYKEYVLQERIFNSDYEDNYRDYINAYQNYRNSLIEGSKESVNNDLDVISKQYNSLVNELMNDDSLSDTERQSILDFFDNLYPELKEKISQWKLEANVDVKIIVDKKGTEKTQEDIINELDEAFGSRSEIEHYNEDIATPEQIQAISDMNALLAQRDVTEKEFLDYLEQEGKLRKGLKDYTKDSILSGVTFDNQDTEDSVRGAIDEFVNGLSNEDLEIFTTLELDKETSLKNLYKSRDEIAKKMKKYVVEGSSVDLFNRPQVQMDDGSIATVLTQLETRVKDGKGIAFHVTPILPSGEILDEDTLINYVDSVLLPANNAYEADNPKNGGKGILIKADVDLPTITYEDGFVDVSEEAIASASEWDNSLHMLQGDYYSTTNAADLYYEALQNILNEAKLASQTPFEINFDKKDIEATTSGIKELQSTYQTLYEAMQEGKEGSDLAFLMSDIEGLKEKLVDAEGNVVDLGDTWGNFFDIMTDGSHSFEEMENALNQVLTAYVNSTVDLENFDRAQADAISTQLQLAGVTKESADAYVDAMLSLAETKQMAEEATFDLSNATIEEINEFSEEIGASESTRQELALLALQKQATNGLTINTQGDINNLLSLANAAGVAVDALQRLSEIKATYDTLTSQQMSSKNARTRAILSQQRLSLEQEMEDLKADIQNDIMNFKPVDISMDRNKAAKSSGSGGSSKESDPWKEAYEKELAALDHLHEMELISDIQYYEEREKLNDKYFKDNTKYTEEYNKNLEQIYKGFQSAYKQYVDDMSDYWKKSLEAGKISFQQYCNSMKTMLEDLHNAGKLNDQDYYNNLADYYGTIVENYDKAINAVQRALKKQIDGLEKQKEQIEKNYQAQIDSIQSEIDALNKANEERQKQLDLQKALYELNRAENQRTQMVYESDKGFVYRANEKDIKNAQDEVEQTQFEVYISTLEEKINSLEEEMKNLTDGIDAQIDKIQEYSDKWGEVANKFKEQQEDMVAASIWGSDWKNNILALDETVLTDFTNNYISMQQQQADAAAAAANIIVAAYNAQIDAINKLKEAQSSVGQTSGSSASVKSSSVGVSNNVTRTSDKSSSKRAIKYAWKDSSGKVHYEYGHGTDKAKPGYHEVAESGDEIILDNYGHAYLAEGHQLHKFEGGEKVFDATETQELLKGKYLPIESILPDYSSMLSKVLNSNATNNYSPTNAIVTPKNNNQSTIVDNSFNITIGDIHVTEVDNASQFAKVITNELPNALLQELNRK